MFGIYLGETTDTLKKRTDVVKSLLRFKDSDHPGQIWDVWTTNSDVLHLRICTLENQIYDIAVTFVDGGRANYEVIKAQLGEIYKSKDEGGISGALFGKGDFNSMIDGIKINIQIDHDVGFMEDDKLELHYTHTPLESKVLEEIQRRKANKVKDEL